jgi:pimeloyl-ACP methyl ester carboxylesterase
MKTKYNLFALFLLICVSSSFSAEDVKFKNENTTLSGTLYTPNGEGPFPAVIFVHGSGPETRNNSRYSAKWLKSLGYVVLTYDKRGTGESGGDEKSINRFSFIDLANDAIAGVNFLASIKTVDKSKIGIHAASQGGWVAALAASKSSLISFMIIKSASVCSVEADRIFERSARLLGEGFSPKDIEEVQEMQLAEAKTSSGFYTADKFTQLFEENKFKPWFNRVYSESAPFDQELVAYRIWYATIAKFDPITYLDQVQIPIFWIFGDPKLDKFGPIELSISNLVRLNSKPYKIEQFDGETHNVKEKKYELILYNWLCEVNNHHSYKFKKH